MDASFRFLTEGRRPVTLGLLALMTLGFVSMLALGSTERAPGLALEVAGRSPVAIWGGEWWRLLTAPFVHINVGRLIGSCVGILFFGSFLESRIGSFRLALIFAASTLAGALADLWLAPTLGGGAGPGVLGVLVACLAVLLRFPADEDDVTRAGIGLAAAVGILLTVGIATFGHTPDNVANGGGFVTGLLLGMLVGTRRRPEPMGRRLAMAATVLALGAATAIVLQPNPDLLSRWHVIRGAHAFNAGDYDVARAEWNTAASWNPSNASARWHLAILHQRFGPVTVFRRELAEALRLEPANADMQERLAEWLLQQGQAAEAEATLRLVVRLVPERGRAWRMLGEAQRLQGREKEAQASLERALEKEPGNPDALFSLAQLHESHGRADQARKYWQALAARRPAGGREVAQVAQARLTLGRFAEASEVLDAGLRESPRSSDLLVLRALARACLGRFPEASQDASAAARLEPGAWRPAWYRARVLEWWAEVDAPNEPPVGRIRAAFQEALAASGDEREALLTRGHLALHTGTLGPRFAERNALDLLEAHRRDPEVWYLLGLALLRQGQQPAARSAFKEAVRLAPTDPEMEEALRRSSRAPAPPRRG